MIYNYTDREKEKHTKISLCIKNTREYHNNGKVKLEFKGIDTGIGIAKEKLCVIFNSFTQADSSNTRKYGGTGLGLTICESLVRQMSGDIWVDSELNKGSTFRFTLTFDVSDNNLTACTQEFQASHHPIKRAINILIVEDDEINRVVIEKFCMQKGWQIVSATNGKEVVDYCTQLKFNAIIMDVQMPVMDGYTATRIIRKMEKENGEHTPIIAMTAYSQTEHREKCLEAGMNEYLTQLMDVPEFYATFKKWLKV